MTFVKGQSGNPGGRRKPDAAFVDAIKKHTVDAVNVIAAILKDDGGEPADRLKAGIWICERAYGKPSQALEVSGPGGSPFAIQILGYDSSFTGNEGEAVPALAETADSASQSSD